MLQQTHSLKWSALKWSALCAAVLGVVLAAAFPVSAQVATVDELRYPPLPEANVPAPERHVLDNGMVVILVEDKELPLINARMLIRTGTRLEPADKVGLASLTGQMLRSGGTENRPSDVLDDYLEDMAASIETSISTRVGTASLNCLRDDFPELLEVFAEVLREPAFEQDKLDVAKNQINAGIARRNDDIGGITAREFRKLIYGADSPYAREATYETIASIERQDLIDWHARYYHPDRMTLGLVGDFDSEEVLKLVDKVFGPLPRGPQFTDPKVPAQAVAAPGIYYVEKNDVTQSYVRIGHLGIQRDDPDYYKVDVMNQVLGGSFAARLFNNVRSKKGLAYNVFGVVQAMWDHPGLFFMSMSTKTETTAAGIDALLEEARNMTAKPPDDAEVDKAKSGMLNSFVFTSDSKSEILGQQLSFEYYGYPLDWLDRYRQGIANVKTGDVIEAAEKYIREDEFVVLVVGPSEGQDRSLDTYGEVTQVDITTPEPEAPAIEMTAEGQARANELLELAVQAIGGPDVLAAVRQLETKSSATMSTPQGEMSANSRTLMAFPDRYRQELALPFATLVQVINGDDGFMVTPQGTMPMPSQQMATLRQQMQRNLLNVLRHRGSDGFKASASGEDEVAGTAVETVQVELDGQNLAFGIDPGTGNVLKLAHRGQDITGAPGEIVQEYSDFRTVDGLTLPFAVAVTFNGSPMLDAVVEEMTVNGEEDPSAFAEP